VYEFAHYRARDIMTRDPVVLKKTLSLKEIQKIFEKHDFNSLPVTDDEGNLLGIVTKLDLLRAFAFGPQSMVPRYNEIMDREADVIMNHDPETVSPETPATRILEKMVRSRRKSFPVVEGSKLVGIVAREDILKALREASEGKLPREV